MSFRFWRKRNFSYSDPFLVTTSYAYGHYFQWRRDNDTGHCKLVKCSFESVFVGHGMAHHAPDPITCFPPLIPQP